MLLHKLPLGGCAKKLNASRLFTNTFSNLFLKLSPYSFTCGCVPTAHKTCIVLLLVGNPKAFHRNIGYNTGDALALSSPSPSSEVTSHTGFFSLKSKNKNAQRVENHRRRGKGMAESFSREKLRHARQEGG